MRFEDWLIREGYRFVVNEKRSGWVRNGKFVAHSVLWAAWQEFIRQQIPEGATDVRVYPSGVATWKVKHEIQ